MFFSRLQLKQAHVHLLGGRVLDELNTLADVASQALVALCQKLLLVVVGRRNDIDGLLGTLGAELDGYGEEVTAVFLLDGVAAVHAGEVDECGLRDGRLALDGLEKVLGETEAGVGHGEGCGTGTVLGLDDLVTTELDAFEKKLGCYSVDLGEQKKLTVGKGIELVPGNLDGGLGLAPQRNNGLARVTANDRNGGLAGVALAGDLGNKGLCADNIESGDTEQLLGVELASGLEDLGGNGDSAVDGVGDDEDESVGAVFGDTLDEVSDDTGVDLEQVVTGHARLACCMLELVIAEECFM